MIPFIMIFTWIIYLSYVHLFPIEYDYVINKIKDNPLPIVGAFIIFLFLILFVLTYILNKKASKNYPDYVKRVVEEHRLLCEGYDIAMQSYGEQLKKARLQENEEEQAFIDFRNQKSEYEKQLSEYEKQLPEYERQCLEYELNVIKARESLWERARVCMRCGKAYLGGVS